jgi:type I restriction enzyme, S subunit
MDEKIAVNRRKIAELEALAKTVYDYWFVQFDFPDAHGRPYRSSGGKMTWNASLKREVPEGWEVETVASLGEVVSGGTPSTANPDYWSDDGIAWITPKDLASTSNKYIRHGEHDISELGLKNSSARLMPRKSVLLSTRAPIGYVAVADCDLCTNQGFKSVVPAPEIGSEFVYQAIKSLVPYLKTMGAGSTFAEVSKTDFESVRILLPPQMLLRKFDEIISAAGEKRRLCEMEVEALTLQRDTLLPLLMNGQVEVAG